MSHENWYNILTDRLPDSVEVNGKTYPVHTSFRDWISFFFLHEDADLTDIEKVTLAMNWYRNTIPGNKAAAYQALQEFAVGLVRGLNLKSEKESPSSFKDVRGSEWYGKAISIATAQGIIKGRGDGNFDPNANITRQEAMSMLARALLQTKES